MYNFFDQIQLIIVFYLLRQMTATTIERPPPLLELGFDEVDMFAVDALLLADALPLLKLLVDALLLLKLLVDALLLLKLLVDDLLPPL